MNLISKRLSKTRFIGRVIGRLPFVRCVILNGSLASGGHKKSSDVDILIIAEDERIFTARFFVNVFATVLGIKRSSDRDKLHAGKFCFNYFLTASFLKIPTGRGAEMDRYCAQNYSKSQFIAGDIRVFNKFMEANETLFKKHGFKYKKSSVSARPSLDGKIKNHNDNSKFRIVSLQPIAEHIFADWFEKLVKNYQIRRIEKDPRTKKYPSLVVYNDRELRFHPPRLSTRANYKIQDTKYK